MARSSTKKTTRASAHKDTTRDRSIEDALSNLDEPPQGMTTPPTKRTPGLGDSESETELKSPASSPKQAPPAAKAKAASDDEEENEESDAEASHAGSVEVVEESEDETPEVPAAELTQEPANYELQADGTALYHTKTTMVVEKANWYGIYVPETDGTTMMVHQFTNGVHFRCNEIKCPYPMKFMAAVAAKAHGLGKVTRTMRDVILKHYEEETKALAKTHGGYKSKTIPDRHKDQIVKFFKGYITGIGEGANPMLDRVTYQYAMGRLGKRGYRVDGDATDTARAAIVSVIVWMSNMSDNTDNQETWTLPLLYMLDQHMVNYRRLPTLGIPTRTMDKKEYDTQSALENKRCTNEAKNKKWYREKRPEVIQQLEEFVSWYEKNEKRMFPEVGPTLVDYYNPNNHVGTPKSASKKREMISLSYPSPKRAKKSGNEGTLV